MTKKKVQENIDVKSGKELIESIENLSLADQNRTLKEQVKFIEKLNKIDLDSIKKIDEKVSSCNFKETGGDESIDLKEIRRQNHEDFTKMYEICQRKKSEAKRLAAFCISHYDDEKSKMMRKLQSKRGKMQIMNDMVQARLDALDDLYETKTKREQQQAQKIRRLNYFYYQMISDEMYRRIGRDVGESDTYSKHLQKKKRLVRNIIRHNQDLMSTEDGKSSTSSSSTASIVESLKRDVDRLEKIIDDYCDQVPTKESSAFLFPFENNSEDEYDDDFFLSLVGMNFEVEDDADIASIAEFSNINFQNFLAANDEEIFENRTSGDTKDLSTTSSIKIVDGDELSYSDFSI